MLRIFIISSLLTFLLTNNIFSQEENRVYSDIQTALQNPLDVKELYLNNKGLSKIPDEVLKFYNLEVLDISGNNIRVIPAEIQYLKNLKKLNISNMPSLDIFDALQKISPLKKLKELIINQKKIAPIPNKSQPSELLYNKRQKFT